MLRFTVQAPDGAHTITLSPTPSPDPAEPQANRGKARQPASAIAATFDGIDEHIDVVSIGASTYSVLYKGKSFVVDLEQKSAEQPILARIDGETFSLTVTRGEAGAAARAEGSDEGETIFAPIPGRVVRVLAEAGKTVAAGTPLIIIEAMKMENVLVARTGGIVTRVLTSAGQTVEAGQLVIELALEQRPTAPSRAKPGLDGTDKPKPAKVG